jgi:CRP/FNR family transcriptional regulator, cyclic AMP receptor protein
MPELKQARDVAAQTGWLSRTPETFRTRVLERTTLRTLSAGEVLHVAGDDAIRMYGVTAGTLRAGISALGHGPYFVHLFGPGAWIGEGPSIPGRPRIITPTAAGACRLLFLPQSAILEIVRREPDCWRFFALPLQGHIELAVGALADSLLRDPTKRVIAALLRLGGRRTGPADAGERIDIDASQEEIAVMANLARTTAGLILGELAKAGSIEIGYGKLILVGPAQLRTMIGE